MNKGMSLAFASIMVFCGCNSTPVSTVIPVTSSAVITHADFRRVDLDGFQARTVFVDDVRRSKTNDGYERVQVFIKNMTGDPIRTRYRFNWYDKTGVEVADPDHDVWDKLTLDPGDDGVFTSIAPRCDCHDFKLRMKRIL